MPTKLLDQDVILVVIHYRLGTLGFFCLNTEGAPGNAALWDQIEAMKWIRDNIEGFGGDKNRVTIFGESAGSASVNYHLLLPESRARAARPSSLVIIFLSSFPRSSTESSRERLALEHWSHIFLSSFPRRSLPRRGEMGFRGAAPVTQKEGLAGTLVTKLPEEYFADGDVADVPLMIGANKHEGSFVLGSELRRSSRSRDMDPRVEVERG
ncbi:Esterase FE4 [Penaeus vannamei]|uniref:Carboxylic ester hydrolase n=1 Tax=Penaeus vannamei TaxID=6689 RepID=A0A423SL50_PENVA|nr:Esterase FE4 [Penaeus vannamei]